jgi:hypothetical protein
MRRCGHDLPMNGYEVLTTDDHRIGSVVEDRGDYLIVESGRLRKSRHALPKAFAHPVDAEQIVRVTVSKGLVADSPKVGAELDERAVARHYGLAGGYDHPETEGAGVLLADDPAESAAVDGARHGIVPAEQERAEIREGHHDMTTPHVRDRSASAADPFGQAANH